MSDEQLDYEKCCLIIYRDMQGKFNTFQWIPLDEHPLEETSAKIIEYNKEQSEKYPDTGRQAELITDPLIREICAYSHKKFFEKAQEESGETLKKEARDRIRRAIDLLEDVESDLE